VVLLEVTTDDGMFWMDTAGFLVVRCTCTYLLAELMRVLEFNLPVRGRVLHMRTTLQRTNGFRRGGTG